MGYQIRISKKESRWGCGFLSSLKVPLSNHKVIWTGTTQDTRIALPEEIRAQMKPGERYSWQVKVYSRKGMPLAESRTAQSTIAGLK